jgi:tripartite-type tricarboxylate transporter receptor subunit TctC
MRRCSSLTSRRRHRRRAATASTGAKSFAEAQCSPKPMTPAEFGKLVSDETEKWRKVVEFAGVSVD